MDFKNSITQLGVWCSVIRQLVHAAAPIVVTGKCATDDSAEHVVLECVEFVFSHGVVKKSSSAMPAKILIKIVDDFLKGTLACARSK